jgi:dipeptidase D
MEKNLKMEIVKESGEYILFSSKDTKEILNLLNTIPHGVLGMSFDVEGLVETSNNLAIVDIKDGKLDVFGMLRSSAYDRIKDTETIYTSLAELIEGNLEFSERSIPWKPNIKSQLLQTSKDAYKKLYNVDPKIGAIHAGLECGVIGEKFEGMDMISIGPSVFGCHTPDEKLYIPSIKKVYDWVTEIIG